VDHEEIIGAAGVEKNNVERTDVVEGIFAAIDERI
jgi:hypothetical protein